MSMSVLIKGMKMPTRCIACQLNYDSVACILTGSRFYKYNTEFDPGEERLSDCPLIPAADVRPVVRGRWIGNKRHQSCSECHMTYCVPDGQDGELDMTSYHFCPNCGADMREES